MTTEKLPERTAGQKMEPAEPSKVLTPAAQRALAEAEARRLAAQAGDHAAPKEVNGPKGLEPTRYGDWETKGIASDF
jgi:hypothetical protein